MKISEVHSKLDRRCVIAIRQHTGIFGLLARMDQRIPAYTFTEDDKTYIQLFFPKSGKPAQSMNPILSRKDLVEKRSSLNLRNCVWMVNSHVFHQCVIGWEIH